MLQKKFAPFLIRWNLLVNLVEFTDSFFVAMRILGLAWMLACLNILSRKSFSHACGTWADSSVMLAKLWEIADALIPASGVVGAAHWSTCTRAARAARHRAYLADLADFMADLTLVETEDWLIQQHIPATCLRLRCAQPTLPTTICGSTSICSLISLIQIAWDRLFSRVFLPRLRLRLLKLLLLKIILACTGLAIVILISILRILRILSVIRLVRLVCPVCMSRAICLICLIRFVSVLWDQTLAVALASLRELWAWV